MTTHADWDNKLILATQNVENWQYPADDAVEGGKEPALAVRKMVLQPLLSRLNADVLSLQEVHAQGGDISALNELIKGTRYQNYHMAHTVQTGKKKGVPLPMRNLVVLSKHEIVEVKQYHGDLIVPPMYRMITAIPAQKEATVVKWERPTLHTKIRLPNGKILHNIVIHPKSKLPAAIPGQMENRFTWKTIQAAVEGAAYSALQRLAQAMEVRALVDLIFAEDPLALIAVVGDYNCDIDELPAKVIQGDVTETENPAHVPFQLFPCENSVSADRRWTHLHHGVKSMLDHVMASMMLHSCHTQTFIHNETVIDESRAFSSDVKHPRPDHGGMRVEFNFDHASTDSGVTFSAPAVIVPQEKATGKKPARKTAAKRTTATKPAKKSVAKPSAKKPAARKRTTASK